MELEKNSDVKSKRRCFDQTSHLFSCSEEAEHVLVGDVAAGTNHSGFDQACSANVSELNLSEERLPYLSSSLDADIEMYNKNRVYCAQLDQSKKEADELGMACDNTHFNCGECSDGGQNNVDEDSQLEYLSAHEQDFDDMNSSSEFSEQKVTIEIKTLKLTDPVHEVPGSGVAKEQNLAGESEDDAPASEYGVDDQTSPEAATPELPHLLQHSLSLPDCNGDPQEEQTEYHSVVCGSILESQACESKEGVCPNLLVCGALENREVKDMTLIGGTLPPQPSASEEVSEENNRHARSISVKQDSPLSPQERAPAGAMQCCERAGDADFYSCKGSGVCPCGGSCVGCAAKDAKAQFPVSAVLTNKNPFVEVEVAEKSTCGNTSCPNSEHHENLKNITSDSMVNQAIDASADFRACYTTSRSTSAQVCLSSKGMNTEVMMMNRSCPVGWCCETRTDIAHNPDWSCGAGRAEKIWSQPTDTLGKHRDGNTAMAERSLRIQEQQKSEIELCSSDLKISTDRLVCVDKQTVKNSASSCCQKTLQRAIAAELQILKAHYQMCYQHCLKIYKLALEENTCFCRYSGNTELDSSLVLILEELKKKYNSMRMKIETGIPLNALPPLSVKMKLFPISSSYAPCKLFREDLCYENCTEISNCKDIRGNITQKAISVSGAGKADLKAPEPQVKKILVNVENPQTICLTDGGQSSDSASSKAFEEQHKDQDVEHEAKIMESENECSFICVGGLSSSVSEDDLRSHFQKYQISDILISAHSSNYRYAILSFKDTNKAKLAVEEMNQKKIKEKPVSVELVKTSSENKYVISQVLLNKLWHKIQPVGNSQRNDQGKTVTSASNSAKAPDATSASEKTHLLPITSSKISCSTSVPSETKCPGLKSSSEDSDTGRKVLQKTSAPFSTGSYGAFISSNTLNLSSFPKLLKKIQAIHPEASRDKIVDALLEVKKNNKGTLSGLSISSIVERTSVILKNDPSHEGEKPCK